MQILISCAKTMTARSSIKVPETYQPKFYKEAGQLILQLMQYTVPELEKMLRVNAKIATENALRYHHFHGDATPSLAAILAYTGIVFKRINPKSFNPDDFLYAQKHLFITSFLYGLLRPLDQIKNYRLEGNVLLPEHHGKNMFDYWKPLLTQQLVEQTKADDGVLINLASDEMKGLFDWETIEKELFVITPEFKVKKDNQLKTIVIYTKMCRGEMTRYILKNRLIHPDKLKTFEWEGFFFNETKSTEHQLLFTME